MKNQFYLVILIVSLAVCGVIMFRPQTADRALGLLGLQDKASSSYVASEWDRLTDSESPDNFVAPDNSFAFDNTSFGVNFDGFSVASPFQATPLPMQPYSPVVDAGTSNEGVAVSGTKSGTTPDFSSFPAELPVSPGSGSQGLASHGQGFGGYSSEFAGDPSPSGASEIAIQFGGSASSNASPGFLPVNDDHAGEGFAQSMPSHSQTPGNIAIGFADYVMSTQTVIDSGFAASEILSAPPAADMSFGGRNFAADASMANASIVMPDPHYGGGFGDYHPSMTSSELDARILPPAEVPAITWGTPNHSPTGPIAQPIMTPGHVSSENAVISVQGMVVPSTPLAYPAGTVQPLPQTTGVPQFQTPVFETPQSVPPMQETPLYVPPSGSHVPPMQQAQPLPQMMQPPPITSQPVAPLVPQTAPQQQPLPSGLQSTVAIASAMRHDLPVTDMRAQYEPKVITEIETVFATEMLARIGTRNVVMTCDILADVRERLDNAWAMQYKAVCEEYGQKPSPLDERNFKADGMQVLFEETLDEWIDLHVKYLDMTLNVPGDRFEDFRKQMSNTFDAEVIPKMTQHYGVTNRYDLDRELRKYGTTLDRKKANFLVQQLAQGWFSEIAKQQKAKLTYDDVIGYYEEHKEERYKIPGQAEWEELAVFFSETTSEQEAYAKIAALGNRIVKGESFAEVAKQGSHGLTAYRGGEREATVGSLKTKTLEQAVFSLPVGKMSTIIREDTGGTNAGVYIVRVTKRQDTRYTPFDQVQGEIQKLINEERFLKEQERVFAEIQKRIPVIKANNLQQIILMASEAERNAPIEDTPERHARLIAKVERLDPTKKDRNGRKGQEQMVATRNTSSQSPSGTDAQPAEQATRIVLATNPSGTQNGSPPTWEPEIKTSSAKEEEPKKKTFLQSLNPFK
ncbi:MAG: peptidylprolyl isomerase [Planctomycetaceae bacterium]|nr:peptidylprolyl isomerase [Planctomycetaceae bacterium]